ncbi:MAG: hypothetical protein K6B17_05820 [Treponema sp.]|nr:hypothetical protein [Treponema sp.]
MDKTITHDQINIHFNKIKFINSITDSIAAYGVQCGLKNFTDDLDMNCGAVPEGEIDQIIDPSSPLEFLSLYTKISCDRFAMTVIQISMLHPNCKKAICSFLRDIGKQNQSDKIASPKNAVSFLENIILEGNIEDTTKEIISSSEKEIVWKSINSMHEKSWNRFKGDINLFYELLETFINAILENTKFIFKRDGELFVVGEK